MKRLIRYSETPQITGLEYNEIFYLEKKPSSKSFFEFVAKVRSEIDNNAYLKV